MRHLPFKHVVVREFISFGLSEFYGQFSLFQASGTNIVTMVSPCTKIFGQSRLNTSKQSPPYDVCMHDKEN